MDPTILDLCQLQAHYRVIMRLTHKRDARAFYGYNQDMLTNPVTRCLIDEMRSHLIYLERPE
jgi:hypothetical protein